MPAGWRHWEPARKIEWLLQIPLDRCMEILSWDPATLEPRLLAAQVEIFQVVLTIGSSAACWAADRGHRPAYGEDRGTRRRAQKIAIQSHAMLWRGGRERPGETRIERATVPRYLCAALMHWRNSGGRGKARPRSERVIRSGRNSGFTVVKALPTPRPSGHHCGGRLVRNRAAFRHLRADRFSWRRCSRKASRPATAGSLPIGRRSVPPSEPFRLGQPGGQLGVPFSKNGTRFPGSAWQPNPAARRIKASPVSGGWLSNSMLGRGSKTP
jgi:hypothetical protein